MPTKQAKARKWKKQKLNAKWKIEGRTARQHKKWLQRKKKTKQHI